MASIETVPLKNGGVSYRAHVRMKGHKKQSQNFLRLTDAKAWARNTEAAIFEGRHFKTSEAKHHTVGEVVERYIEKVKRENPQRLTDVEPMLRWWVDALNDCLLSELSKARVTEAIDRLCQKKMFRRDKHTDECYEDTISLSRVNRYMFAMSKACTVATDEWEWMEENPFLKIKKFKEPRGRVRYLSEQERESLLKACQESWYPHLYLIAVLGISTGCRRSEIMGLEWKDIDFERGQFVLHNTKNGERRTIPLVGRALELMQAHRKVRRMDSFYVFPSVKGDKPYEIKKPWLSAVKDSGVRDFRFHDLRHCAASYLAMSGATTYEIAETLGHKTLHMVKRYAHLSDAHTKDVVTKMNERIFGDSNG